MSSDGCLCPASEQQQAVEIISYFSKHVLLAVPWVQHTPTVCMSAFSIKVQQHNEKAEMNMSVAKSILRSPCSECLLIPDIFCPELENRHVS